jgi:hypothetical protein
MSQAKPTAVPERARLNIDFGDNTKLSDAVNHLLGMFRNQSEDVNVLVKGDGASVAVPPMSLQMVTFDQAIKAVCLACEPTVEANQAEPGVLVLRVLTNQEIRERNTKLRAFNVSDFLRRLGAGGPQAQLKVLEASIHAGIGARRRLVEVDDPILEAHIEGGLLFAQGDATSLEVVAEVVQALCPTSSPAHVTKP